MLQTQNPYSRERIDALTTMLAGMDARGRQAYAAQHRNDPAVIATAVHVNNTVKAAERAKAMQAAGPMPTVVDQNLAAMTSAPAPAPVAQTQLPENQGIAQIPAPNIQRLADGGIAGYEDDEEGMATGGMGGMFNFAQQSEPVVRMAGGGMAGYMPGFKNTGAVNAAFEAALEKTLKYEGGYVKDDAGKGESNFGINKSANPDVDVKNLTKEKARELYKKRYWDAIGGDALAAKDPALATIAFDTAVNMGVSKASQLIAQSKGDPSAMLSLRQQHYDNLIKDNPKKFAPYAKGWKDRVADLATSVIPSAQAGELPKPAPAAAPDLASQIPGSKVAPRDPSEKDRYITGNQGVIGAGETALQYLTGTLAIPTAGGAAALEQVPNMLSGIFGSGKGIDRAELEKSFRDKAAQVTYEPRTVGGKTVSESTAKTLEDLKVPSYLARIGSGASVRRPSAGAADVKALAKEAAATAAEKTKTADTLRLPPPSEQGIAGLAKNAETILVDSQGNALPPKTPPAVAPVKGAARAAQEGERVATGDRLLNLAKDKAEAAEARKAAEGWAKAEEATTKADAQNMLADERFGQTNRAQGIATLTGATPATISESDAATAAANAAAAATPFKGIDDAELQRMQEANQAPMTKDDIVKAAEEVTPVKERKGFSNDDLLTLGLNLLASKSPNFMTALGEAGLATVAGKKEREKLEREATKSGVELDYMKARTKEAEAQAAYIERGGREKKMELEAEKMIQNHMADWLKSMEGKASALGADGGIAKQREEDRVRTAIYASLGIPSIIRPQSAASSGGGGFKFLGVQ